MVWLYFILDVIVFVAANYKFWFRLNESYVRILRDIVKTHLEVFCFVKYGVPYDARRGASSGDSEVWEQVLLKTLEAHISRIKKYYSLIFSPILSKLVSTFDKIFQFKKCGISYGLPIWYFIFPSHRMEFRFFSSRSNRNGNHSGLVWRYTYSQQSGIIYTCNSFT